jgi:hypothetical protein
MGWRIAKIMNFPAVFFPLLKTENMADQIFEPKPPFSATCLIKSNPGINTLPHGFYDFVIEVIGQLIRNL